MSRHNRRDGEPDPGATQNIWGEIEITPVAYESSAVTELLQQLRYTHANGGAHFAAFKLTEHPILSWFWANNRLSDIDFFRRFVTRRQVIAALPELQITKPLGRKLEVRSGNPFTLDGILTGILVQGGAYRKFEGTRREAKALTMAFCDEIIGERYNEVQLFESYSPWTSWFHDIAWDYTFFGIEEQCTHVWMLCITDTD